MPSGAECQAFARQALHNRWPHITISPTTAAPPVGHAQPHYAESKLPPDSRSHASPECAQEGSSGPTAFTVIQAQSADAGEFLLDRHPDKRPSLAFKLNRPVLSSQSTVSPGVNSHKEELTWPFPSRLIDPD